MNVEADALSCILWENTQVEHMEPLIVKTMLQSKLESEMSLPNEYLPVNLLLKSMTVDTTLTVNLKRLGQRTNGQCRCGQSDTIVKIKQVEHKYGSRN